MEAAAPSIIRPSESAEVMVSLNKAVTREELANAGIQPVCSITQAPVTPATDTRPSGKDLTTGPHAFTVAAWVTLFGIEKCSKTCQPTFFYLFLLPK